MADHKSRVVPSLSAGFLFTLGDLWGHAGHGVGWAHVTISAMTSFVVASWLMGLAMRWADQDLAKRQARKRAERKAKVLAELQEMMDIVADQKHGHQATRPSEEPEAGGLDSEIRDLSAAFWKGRARY